MNPKVDKIEAYVFSMDAFISNLFECMINSDVLESALFSNRLSLFDSLSNSEGGVVLLDFDIEASSGIEVIRQIRSLHASLPIICTSSIDAVCKIGDELRMNHCKFVSKNMLVTDFVKTAQSLLLDEKNDQDSIKDKNNQLMLERFSSLTPRELEVFSGLIGGERSKEIAFDLGVSCRTIELHRAHIMKKLEIGTLQELIKILLLCDSKDIFDFCKHYLHLDYEASI